MYNCVERILRTTRNNRILILALKVGATLFKSYGLHELFVLGDGSSWLEYNCKLEFPYEIYIWTKTNQNISIKHKKRSKFEEILQYLCMSD